MDEGLKASKTEIFMIDEASLPQYGSNLAYTLLHTPKRL